MTIYFVLYTKMNRAKKNNMFDMHFQQVHILFQWTKAAKESSTIGSSITMGGGRQIETCWKEFTSDDVKKKRKINESIPRNIRSKQKEQKIK